MKLALVFLMALGVAAPAAAQVRRPPARTQPPRVVFRPFVLVSEERFAASQAFEGVFGKAVQPFIGAGAQMTFRDGGFLEFTFSRFQKDGERAFRFEDENFPLGIPLKATLTPIEITTGYRMLNRRRPRPVVPYFGIGVGFYRYSESSDFSEVGDDVNVSHLGFLGMAGAEFRVHRLLSLSADVQVNQVQGILESTGLAGETKETNLGGLAARFRVIIGK